MSKEVKAINKMIRTSSQKLNLIIKDIRKKDINAAVNILKFSNKKIDLLRLNMSHVKLQSLDKLIKKIKKTTKVPICIDTEGAQIRTKVLISKNLRKGQKFYISKNNGNFKVRCCLFKLLV